MNTSNAPKYLTNVSGSKNGRVFSERAITSGVAGLKASILSRPNQTKTMNNAAWASRKPIDSERDMNLLFGMDVKVNIFEGFDPIAGGDVVLVIQTVAAVPSGPNTCD